MQQRRLQDGFAGGALEAAAQRCFCSYGMGAGARCSPQHLGTQVCSSFAHGLAARSPSPRPAVISAAHLSISLTCSVCARQGHFWRAAACLRACCARASARPARALPPRLRQASHCGRSWDCPTTRRTHRARVRAAPALAVRLPVAPVLPGLSAGGLRTLAPLVGLRRRRCALCVKYVY